MRMTEIVSFMDLSVFPSIALVFFLAAFLAIVWRVMTKSKSEIDSAASIPLSDDVVESRGSFTDTNHSNQSNHAKGTSHV